MFWIILGILISYIIGSLPTAYIFGRLLRGIDIRKFGSGNVGATNALRVLGKRVGVTVLILDMLKGFLVLVFLEPMIVKNTNLISEELLLIVLSLSCILGHSWTVFLKFKGGKGVATTLGVLFGLTIKLPELKTILVIVVLTWLVVFVLTRIVSLASILSCIMLPIYMIIFKQSRILVLFGFILASYIILRHRSNIKRFLQGKESTLF
ncbi:MAG: glycerol-3-phosphate 1-O-acyltransferase PlsY [Candidatus Omnitrophica bacterium]|nr:glycerol-3-phosphate 1-O-acyltransferase PlsY [Candidatus Omnitrophota bacterium]